MESFRRALEVAPGKWEFRLALARLLHDSGLHRDEADLLVQGWRAGPRLPARAERVCEALAEGPDAVDPARCRADLLAVPPPEPPRTP